MEKMYLVMLLLASSEMYHSQSETNRASRRISVLSIGLMYVLLNVFST